MAYSPFRNIGLKFLSICIAALLWLVIAGDRVVERVVRVPIEFQNLPKGLDIRGDPPESVEVRVRGSSGLLGRLGPGDLSAVIDLRNARPGQRLFHLTADEINAPISFENSIVRVVRVRPSIEGRPAPGYEVGEVTSDPATVEVVGPESSLRELDEAMTEPISVENATRPLKEVVTIGVADPAVRLRTPQTASVTVPIIAGSSVKVLKGVPVRVENLAEGLRARLAESSVSVAVRGTETAVTGLTPEALDAQVDARGLSPGDHAVEVRVRAGQGLTIEGIEPQSLRVRITKP